YRLSSAHLPPLPPPARDRPDHRLTMGWSIWDGELTDGDPQDSEGRFDDHLLSLRPGETRLISLESEDFDPYVRILRADDRDGEVLDTDDDGGAGLNSLLSFEAGTGG